MKTSSSARSRGNRSHSAVGVTPITSAHTRTTTRFEASVNVLESVVAKGSATTGISTLRSSAPIASDRTPPPTASLKYV